MNGRAESKRGYLPASQRREELLAAAAEIVGARGWQALTMKGLAAATGVSRQLIYVHFADLSSLLVAVLHHLFEGTRAATTAIVANSDGNRADVARLTYQIYLDLDPAQRRALRSLSGGDPGAPELVRLRRVMRSEILALWVPYVRRQTSLDLRRARARAWMFISAAWGLADLVEDGELSAANAKEQLAAFAALQLEGDRPRVSPIRRRRS